MQASHHDSEPEGEDPGCRGDSDQFNFPRLLNKQKVKLDVNIEAVKYMKTLAVSVAKRDEFTVYREHIENKLRNCGRSRYEIAKALHLIDNICYKLAVGELARLPLPLNFPTQTHLPKQTAIR